MDVRDREGAVQDQIWGGALSIFSTLVHCVALTFISETPSGLEWLEQINYVFPFQTSLIESAWFQNLSTTHSFKWKTNSKLIETYTQNAIQVFLMEKRNRPFSAIKLQRSLLLLNRSFKILSLRTWQPTFYKILKNSGVSFPEIYICAEKMLWKLSLLKKLR